MQGKALVWFLALRASNGLSTWFEFLRAIQSRFSVLEKVDGSFIGYILLTKSLSCNVATLTGIPYYFKVFKYSEIIFLIWKGPYYDNFQYHKLQEGNFRVPGRFCAVFNSAKF
jgi:hypothetical protein